MNKFSNYNKIKNKYTGSTKSMPNTKIKPIAPHGYDPKVLHAPGYCKKCDEFPEWQEHRLIAGINYTDEYINTKIPCPSNMTNIKWTVTSKSSTESGLTQLLENALKTTTTTTTTNPYIYAQYTHSTTANGFTYSTTSNDPMPTYTNPNVVTTSQPAFWDTWYTFDKAKINTEEVADDQITIILED